MSTGKAGLYKISADRDGGISLLDKIPSFSERVFVVAAVAAADADDVDRMGRFPKRAIDAAREQRLLGILVPSELGGDGGSISDVAEMCYTLGRACASTA